MTRTGINNHRLEMLWRWRLDPDGNLIETDPAGTGSRRRGGRAPALREPVLRRRAGARVAASRPPPLMLAGNSVVILRLRGRTDLGTTFMDVLCRYAQALTAADSKLVIVSAGERIQEQLRVTGVTDLISPQEHPRRR